MPSPFPGMDPFLESPAFWPDFHSRFVNAWCEAISDALPSDYEAAIDERVYLVEVDPDVRKRITPDVAVTHGSSLEGSSRTAGVATLEPVTIPLTILDSDKEAYIEILHQPDRTLVTTLELLSPANKNLPGRAECLAKRRALIYQNVNMVELDLLRGGKRLPMERPLPAGDLFYLVSRAEQRPDCQVYGWTLRDVLPMLPVPLRAPDADILIDLGLVFDTTYDRGRFARRLPYQKEAAAEMSEGDREWMRKVLTTDH